jgi:hypothetical protein
MSEINHCQCAECKFGVLHASDCAVHRAPAYPVGECNCGVKTASPLIESLIAAEELFGFYDGSITAPAFKGAHATVIMNAEDFANALANLRKALAHSTRGAA